MGKVSVVWFRVPPLLQVLMPSISSQALCILNFLQKQQKSVQDQCQGCWVSSQDGRIPGKGLSSVLPHLFLSSPWVSVQHEPLGTAVPWNMFGELEIHPFVAMREAGLWRLSCKLHTCRVKELMDLFSSPECWRLMNFPGSGRPLESLLLRDYFYSIHRDSWYSSVGAECDFRVWCSHKYKMKMIQDLFWFKLGKCNLILQFKTCPSKSSCLYE